MKNYDLTLILSPELLDEKANDLFQQFVSFVQEQGGILEDQRLLGKKPLLAPIRDSKEGYLATIAFSLNKENLPALDKKCRETQHILRFLVANQAKKPRKARIALTPTLAPPPAVELSQRKEEKVDLKNIDEK